MLARARAGCVVGVEARPVDVEVHIVNGLPGFDIVGLPEAAVRESRVRVRAALTNSGFEQPPRHVVLNLAPADLRKRGSTYDLAIAIAFLSASGSCAPNRLEETLLFGELSLSGELRPARGMLAQLRDAAARGLRTAVVPRAQLAQASIVDSIDVRGAHDLRSVVAFLEGSLDLPRPTESGLRIADAPVDDLADVHGQHAAKRALEIAAAGHHHVLLVGPPGAGKTMLARRLPGILPRPSSDEALEIATIASAAGFEGETYGRVHRPFRAPHHTASAAALVGGGDPVRPGEVTLAHRGVLFLDELPELGRHSIESFRTILESGVAHVARARERVSMPAEALVVAAMNPCPCGYDGDPQRMCECTPSRIHAYRSRISGPILDRFDIHVSLARVRLEDLATGVRGEPSVCVRARVEAARARARSRPRRPALADQLDALCASSRRLLVASGERFGLSMRGFHRTLNVARTIADLAGAESITPEHVAEALSYRVFDRRELAHAS